MIINYSANKLIKQMHNQLYYHNWYGYGITHTLAKQLETERLGDEQHKGTNLCFEKTTKTKVSLSLLISISF